MAYQWLELKLPIPDFLVPLPTSFWEKQKLGCDPQISLGIELGKILSIPVKPILQRKFDRDRFLTRGEFHTKIQLRVNKNEMLCDRRVLITAPLLDDAQFRYAGNELKAHFPSQIDALAFAAFDS